MVPRNPRSVSRRFFGFITIGLGLATLAPIASGLREPNRDALQHVADIPAASLPETPASTRPAVVTDTEAPVPLDAKAVQAWQAAGWQVGWLRAVRLPNGADSAILYFELGGRDAKAGTVPAFKLSHWNIGTMPPDPGRAFGLDLSNTHVNDAELKELGGIKNLVWLNLGNTKVTDAGMKELAALKGLQSLHLWQTQLTDTGLKDLAGLTSLHALELGGTKVTDVGVKELGRLKNLKWLR